MFGHCIWILTSETVRKYSHKVTNPCVGPCVRTPYIVNSETYGLQSRCLSLPSYVRRLPKWECLFLLLKGGQPLNHQKAHLVLTHSLTWIAPYKLFLSGILPFLHLMCSVLRSFSPPLHLSSDAWFDTPGSLKTNSKRQIHSFWPESLWCPAFYGWQYVADLADAMKGNRTDSGSKASRRGSRFSLQLTRERNQKWIKGPGIAPKIGIWWRLETKKDRK